MKIELNKQELNYLTIIIEQNLEDVNETFVGEDEMLKDLYSKLIVLTLQEKVNEITNKTK